MNVQSRSEFDQFLAHLRTEEVKVFDTETNTLKMYQQIDPLISLSVYFPRINVSYNLPFRYGHGTVEINYTKENHIDRPFEKMTWQGSTKRQLYLAYWFEQMKPKINFKNLPVEWLDEVRAAWGSGTYIGHNTRFDAHVLHAEGFPDMERVYDTMVGLHIVDEDWSSHKYVAPYTYTKKDEEAGKGEWGRWARNADGSLMTKSSYGNRRLKWQAALRGYKAATEGEEGLSKARESFEEDIVQYIMDHLEDPMNASLLVKVGRKSDEDWYAAQWEKIRSRIKVDEKSNMWMLPSDRVAHYAELDVELTYKLYQDVLIEIAAWNNLDLWETQSKIHHLVAWEMERWGFKLDVAQAQAEIEKLDPRILELDAIIREAAIEHVADNFGHPAVKQLAAVLEDEKPFTINSPAKLLALLNSDILSLDFGTSLFPEWWDQEKSLNLKTYQDIRLNEGEIEDSEYGEVFDPLDGTAKAALDTVEDHPIVRIVREYRRMNKMSNTYLKKWLKARDKNDIVRFSVNDDGTVTGRTSSSGEAGNGQNLPDRNGYTIKRAIVPYDENWRLWSIDYSQLELKLAAWIAEGLLGFDPNMTMTNLFLSGNDMHAYVRDMIDVRTVLFGDMSDRDIASKLGYKLEKRENDGSVRPLTDDEIEELVNKYTRGVAKTLNFGLLYSGTWRMIARTLKIEREPAEILTTRWKTMFPAFQKAQDYYTELALTERAAPAGMAHVIDKALVAQPTWVRETVEGAVLGATPDISRLVKTVKQADQWTVAGSYVTQPISGRHRRTHRYENQKRYKADDGTWKSFNEQEATARKCWNSVVQGLGGYLCMASALKINEKYGRDQQRMFVQIHDALDGYVHVDHMHIVEDFGQIMTDWPEIVPPLSVDISGSKDGTWQEMASIKNMTQWVESTGTSGYPVKK